MGKTTFLHSCLKTIALRGRRYPTVTISYCSFSRVSWQVEHRHVQHIRKWCGQQHELKPLEAFSPLESFRVKWIILYEITRKSWSLTSTVFKTRKRNIMKTFKIKTDRKLPRVQRNPKWRLMWENSLARFKQFPICHGNKTRQKQKRRHCNQIWLKKKVKK